MGEGMQDRLLQPGVADGNARVRQRRWLVPERLRKVHVDPSASRAVDIC